MPQDYDKALPIGRPMFRILALMALVQLSTCCDFRCSRFRGRSVYTHCCIHFVGFRSKKMSPGLEPLSAAVKLDDPLGAPVVHATLERPGSDVLPLPLSVSAAPSVVSMVESAAVADINENVSWVRGVAGEPPPPRDVERNHAGLDSGGQVHRLSLVPNIGRILQLLHSPRTDEVNLHPPAQDKFNLGLYSPTLIDKVNLQPHREDMINPHSPTPDTKLANLQHSPQATTASAVDHYRYLLHLMRHV